MKIDRLLGILTILLQNERVNAPYLAARFEVSRRTIGRDVDALCQAGIPIVTRQGEGGGISIAEGYKLDKSILTTEELSGIIAALKGIGTVTDTSQIERTLDKFSASKDAVVSLQEPIVIDLASHYRGSLSPKIKMVKEAVINHQLIEFDYYYEKGLSHRRIEPYFVIFHWSAWYVFGYCTIREDWRLFKLARLWELQILPETYVQREIPENKRNLNAVFIDDNILKALFDASVRYQLIDDYGLDCYTETKEGKLLLEVGYTNKEYILKWLLGFGDKVKVLEPLVLAEELKAIALEIYHNYS
ncbi:YafY family protein [Anaerocolumna sp. AGMB13020]|uniref:helix-turn-helix transcriptional regulator n=1 Tax=Anaerocolumna sp. AGMB13020 TaxID=3081750 RepID=UPI002953E1EB|nr:YafY family protein [Anaerocolumna sp. AGMB13020]WOO36764.1 YafY family protein [Anaerocolumna sp. AGMB13020]